MSDFPARGIDPALLEKVEAFKSLYPPASAFARMAAPAYWYSGPKIWNQCIAALLAGQNLLLSGPKSTGKNILAQGLAFLFEMPLFTVSFHLQTDSQSLIGTDTFVDNQVTLRPGSVYRAAVEGGFVVLDEINMARTESTAVLHSALDHRRLLDVPGYDLIRLQPQCRFIATMNEGYAGTKELNEALLSRFMVIKMPLFTELTARSIFQESFPHMTEAGIDAFSRLLLGLQEKHLQDEITEKTIDVRGLKGAAELCAMGISLYEGLEMGIVQKTSDTYEQTLVRDLIKVCFPEDAQGKRLLYG